MPPDAVAPENIDSYAFPHQVWPQGQTRSRKQGERAHQADRLGLIYEMMARPTGFESPSDS